MHGETSCPWYLILIPLAMLAAPFAIIFFAN